MNGSNQTLMVIGQIQKSNLFTFHSLYLTTRYSRKSIKYIYIYMCDLLFSSFFNQTQKIKITAYEIENVQIIIIIINEL